MMFPPHLSPGPGVERPPETAGEQDERDSMETFLIAHTDRAGSGIAQAQVEAATESAAVKQFTEEYPERVITAVGVKGVEG